MALSYIVESEIARLLRTFSMTPLMPSVWSYCMKTLIIPGVAPRVSALACTHTNMVEHRGHCDATLRRNIAGEIYTMCEPNRSHELVVTNLVSDIRAHLRGRPCRTYAGKTK